MVVFYESEPYTANNKTVGTTAARYMTGWHATCLLPVLWNTDMNDHEGTTSE